MSWIKKLFSGESKSTDANKKQELLNKITLSIDQCQSEIQKSEKEIKQIQKWMAELIQENFFVPGDYWYEELKYYEAIKQHKENANISTEKINQVNKLLGDYRTQICFREKKIELKKLMIDKYNNAKQQLDDLSSGAIPVQGKTELKTLEKHQNRIQKLNEEQNDLSTEQEQDEILQQLSYQINELIENKKIDEEVKDFMKKLNAQFSSDIHEGNPERIISEMERLIEEYKSGK